MTRAPDPPGGVTGPQAHQGALEAQVIYVAAKLGVADLVKDGPRPTADLAAATDVDATSLTRFLRALVSLGTFVEMAGDRFALTEVGQYL